MLSVRTGIDLIRISRLAELNPSILRRFLARVFTQAELAEAGDRMEILAGKFAAKEAVAKALGSGIGKIRWQDIEILHNEQGMPVPVFYDNAQTLTKAIHSTGWSISISHESEYAAAVAICLISEEDDQKQSTGKQG